MENEKQKENNETPEQGTKNLISLDNCDFSNKSNRINSPRSLKACLSLGIELSELYKISMDEFKNKYPEVKKLNEDLLKLRYDAEEKFRAETVKQAQEGRKKIIEEEEAKKNNKKNENEEKNNDESNKDDDIKKWEKFRKYIINWS